MEDDDDDDDDDDDGEEDFDRARAFHEATDVQDRQLNFYPIPLVLPPPYPNPPHPR